MSRHTYSDIVKNVAMLGKFRPMIDLYEDADNIGRDCDLGNGWTIAAFAYADAAFAYAEKPMRHEGKRNRLFGDYATKNGKEVCLINTDEYSDVGEHDYAVFSNDRDAVEMFLKDFGLNKKIEDMDSINQTI
jgi:hypothetical protein